MNKHFFKGVLGERYFNPKENDNFEWAMSRTMGDLISGCDGYNHVIKEVRPFYVTVAMELDEDGTEVGPCNQGRAIPEKFHEYENYSLNEVEFLCTDGSLFVFPPCVTEPMSAEHIRESLELDCDEKGLQKTNDGF